MAVKWFRFYTEAAYHREVQELPPPLFKFWVNALCLANANEPRGTLPPVNDIAYALHLTAKQAESYLGKLIVRGLVDGEPAAMHNWKKWQPDSDARATEGRSRGDSAANSPQDGGVDKKKKKMQSRTEEDTEGEVEGDTDFRRCCRVFEDCIGTVDAHTGKIISEAIEDYGAPCVIHCLEEASENGARNWKYASAIMRRHKAEGCYSAIVIASGNDSQAEWLERRYRESQVKGATT